jgi:hypothetical protein
VSVQFAANFPTLTVELGVAGASSSSAWDSALWDSGTWGTDIVWYDISQYLRHLEISRGRARETDRYTGSLSMELDNRTAQFTPTAGLPLLCEDGVPFACEDGVLLAVDLVDVGLGHVRVVLRVHR